MVPDDLKADVTELAAILREARRGVAFTGAGISTESGIPDFRSPGGIWTRYRPISFQEFMGSPQARTETWRRKFAVDDATRGARPNVGHMALARLIDEGRFEAVVTQNIDGLHQASGIAAERVVELHGNGTYARCLACGARHELAWVRARFEASGESPPCEACGGPVKSATIAFGQPMPELAMRRAQALAEAADVFLVLGSSLVVWPAASLPILAKRAGATLVIVNREPTEHDEIADLVIHAGIGEVLGSVAAREN